jgi:hypothetical protein
LNAIDNRRALGMLRFSEGTSNSPTTRDRGYDQIVGRTRFASYADHPRVRVWIPRIKNWSTAAGGYQLLMRYYDIYRQRLGLTGFGPDVQDTIALQQIKECRALPDIDAGRLGTRSPSAKTSGHPCRAPVMGNSSTAMWISKRHSSGKAAKPSCCPLKTSEELHLAFVEAGGVLA